MIEMHHICKTFRVAQRNAGFGEAVRALFRKDYTLVHALQDVSFTIGDGEIVGYIGPNGAGKTTVFNLLTKVYQPTAGAIVLDGKDTHSMTTAQVNRAGIARTFQNIRLFGDLTVAENLMVAMNDSMRYGLVGSILHFPRFAREEHIARERAEELLESDTIRKAYLGG